MLNVSRRFRRCIIQMLIRREGGGIQDDSEDLQHGNGGGLLCFVPREMPLRLEMDYVP